MIPKWNTGKKKNGMTFRHSLFIFGSGYVHSQIVLFVCFICLFAPSVYKPHSFLSGSDVTVHRESFIMGWKSWGEGPAALRKPSERSSGWQHHLQPASRFLFELFALAELADLMAGFAVAAAAALFAVNPAPARWTQAASLPLFLPIGADG